MSIPRLEVIAGCMLAGKSGELIRRLRTAHYGRRRVCVIKPSADQRTSDVIASREQNNSNGSFELSSQFPARPIANRKEFMRLIRKEPIDVLGIDEAQFFGKWLIKCIGYVLEPSNGHKMTIIASGLDMDAWRRPFGIMPQLMAMADDVTKLQAVYFYCHEERAVLTQKRGGSTDPKQIEVGDVNIYEARCRRCHTIYEQGGLL